MLKIIDLTETKNNDSEILSILSNVINSNSTTVEIYNTQFSYFEKLGFVSVEENENELKILKDNFIINEAPFKSEKHFQKIEGNKKISITLTEHDFAPWSSKKVRYLLAVKVFYKNDNFINGSKPAIVFHSKLSLTKDFVNINVFYNNEEIELYYKDQNVCYRKNLKSNKKLFLSEVIYENSVKIEDVFISINNKIFNFKDISKIFPRIKNIKISKMVYFEKVLTREELKLLEMISI